MDSRSANWVRASANRDWNGDGLKVETNDTIFEANIREHQLFSCELLSEREYLPIPM